MGKKGGGEKTYGVKGPGRCDEGPSGLLSLSRGGIHLGGPPSPPPLPCRSAHLLAMLDRGMLKLVKTQILVLESHPW